MRLIGTIENQELAERLSSYLNLKNIDHEVEVDVDKDWGKETYGSPISRVWVIEEDQLEEASKIFEEFQENPDDKKFTEEKTPPKVPVMQEVFEDEAPQKKDEPIVTIKPQSAIARTEPMGPVTFYLIVICSWLFIWGILTIPPVEKLPSNIPSAPIQLPTINKELMYDYPEAYQIIDKIIKLYGRESLLNPGELPAEGKFLLNQFYRSSWWKGIYQPLAEAFKQQSLGPLHFSAPMFEKVQQGEVWRLFTPALLHGSLLHILFNMLWLVVLGKQIEKRVKGKRYLLFILITGIVSNTAQYLMSGANFVGISGVLCAMFAFIWVRLKIAPWEGYQLQQSTITLLSIFILAMFFLQLYAFFSEVTGGAVTSLRIANTAHLTGVFSGLVLGRLPFFSWKQ